MRTNTNDRIFKEAFHCLIPHIVSKTALLALSLILPAMTWAWGQTSAPATYKSHGRSSPPGVCPPFRLMDEEGKPIDPISGLNSDKPYSPKQTCGRCHDYQKITKGYHFMQGKGEEPTPDQKSRCLWAITPGNYGGTWCSPAPLYPYLAPKHNSSPATIDMTSFKFFTMPCGACHPGGGPAEYDRNGKRYDRWMSDPKSGLEPGGINHFDGDYYRARWTETGVLEADCLLCHMPEYNYKERKKQVGAWNFRWAATAGAGFARVYGSIKEGRRVKVVYNKELFHKGGFIEPHIVREPRNKACLSCHAKPGWKKRGANFRPRTDVHLRAGLKCVDCHPAGSSATDPRIKGREVHQFGKGDDPGGHVRDDLDNTCRECSYCHGKGYLGAPIADHRWLPPLHLEKIACQTCHIPERVVKAALVQAGDVFNPGTKIPRKGKYLWTFYGPDGKYWNHYGELEMMGYDDKPTDPFRPKLARYKGKIYPVNRVHSAWPAIQVEGKKALMEPKMSSIYKMWAMHKADPKKYPELSKIRDDNGDNVPEVNRPEEIDALIHSVTRVLKDTKYPMEGKKVVWVMDDRIYTSGTVYYVMEKHEWEASPYGNVHKYNHDIYPAKAALGAAGCTDCHSPGSSFFFAKTIRYLFDRNGRPVTKPQYEVLGISAARAYLGAWREAYLKPIVYGLLIVLILACIGAFGRVLVLGTFKGFQSPAWLLALPWVAAVVLGACAVSLAARPALMAYTLPARKWMDSHHFIFSLLVFGIALYSLGWELKQRLYSGHRGFFGPFATVLISVALIIGCLTGFIIFLGISGLGPVSWSSYTVFDLCLGFMLLGSIIAALRFGLRATPSDTV